MPIQYDNIKDVIGVNVGVLKDNGRTLITLVLKYTTKTGEQASGFQEYVYVLTHEDLRKSLQELSRKEIINSYWSNEIETQMIDLKSLPQPNPLFPYLNS